MICGQGKHGFQKFRRLFKKKKIFDSIAHGPHQIIHKAGPDIRAEKDDKNGEPTFHFVSQDRRHWAQTGRAI